MLFRGAPFTFGGIMKKRYIFIVLTVLMTAFIFWNSSKPAVESTNDSNIFVGFFCALLSRFGVKAEFGIMEVIVRKSAHITEFVIHAMLLAGCFTGKLKKRIIYILFFGLLTACTDEFIQLFPEGRAGLVADIFIDFGGTAIGTGISGLFRKRQ